MYPRQDEKSELYGYWSAGDWVISPRFAYAHRFKSGYAAVSLDDTHEALIGLDRSLHPLEEICGRPLVREDDGGSSFCGFGDYDSEPSDHAMVCLQNRRQIEWGLIDTSLTYRPLPADVFSTVTYASPFNDRILMSRAEGNGPESSWGLFHLDDMQVELPCNFSFIYTSRDSIWAVSRSNRKETYRATWRSTTWRAGR